MSNSLLYALLLFAVSGTVMQWINIAYLNGRSYCVPKDVQEILENVARHRIQLNAKARLNRVKVQEIIEEILINVQAPNPKHG